jgi:hypothetical protein
MSGFQREITGVSGLKPDSRRSGRQPCTGLRLVGGRRGRRAACPEPNDPTGKNGLMGSRRLLATGLGCWSSCAALASSVFATPRRCLRQRPSARPSDATTRVQIRWRASISGRAKSQTARNRPQQPPRCDARGSSGSRFAISGRTVASRHRIGLIVPSSNVTMETEVPALLRERERVRPQDRLPCTVRGLDAAR